MSKELYATLVLASVGLLSYLMRALPFLLFGTRGEPPAVVRYVGRVLSPAAMAMLVVYCYAGELAKPHDTCGAVLAPCLAGLATVILQYRRRNPLLSILAGTAAYMILSRL